MIGYLFFSATIKEQPFGSSHLSRFHFLPWFLIAVRGAPEITVQIQVFFLPDPAAGPTATGSIDTLPKNAPAANDRDVVRSEQNCASRGGE